MLEWPNYISDDDDYVFVPLVVDQIELRRQIWIEFFVEKIAKICNLPSSQIAIPLPAACLVYGPTAPVSLFNIVQALVDIQRSLREEDMSILEQAVIYLMRVQEKITAHNLYSAIVASYLLAYKYNEDFKPFLGSFAYELALSNTELHKIEVHYLKLLKFDLFLQPQEVLQMVLWRFEMVSQQASQEGSHFDAEIVLQECTMLLQSLIDLLNSELGSKPAKQFCEQFLLANQIPRDIKQHLIQGNLLFFHSPKNAKDIQIPYPEITCTML